MEHSSLKKEDLDVVGELFGLKFKDGDPEPGSTGWVDLYIEDDELYHYQMTFDKYWLNDLLKVADAAIKLKGIIV